MDAVAVVPGANGAAHVEACRWLDRFVFPVSEARFLRDLSRVSPATTPLPMTMGGRYRVRPGEVTLDPQAIAVFARALDRRLRRASMTTPEEDNR